MKRYRLADITFFLDDLRVVKHDPGDIRLHLYFKDQTNPLTVEIASVDDVPGLMADWEAHRSGRPVPSQVVEETPQVSGGLDGARAARCVYVQGAPQAVDEGRWDQRVHQPRLATDGCVRREARGGPRMMWLWRWLFPAQPMPGQAWRFHSGDEVAITHVQPEDLPYEIVQSGDSFNDYVRYHGAFVRYRTADGECHKAPYKGFARSGQPVPTYLPVEAT